LGIAPSFQSFQVLSITLIGQRDVRAVPLLPVARPVAGDELVLLVVEGGEPVVDEIDLDRPDTRQNTTARLYNSSVVFSDGPAPC
jgi:hypothetical protein